MRGSVQKPRPQESGGAQHSEALHLVERIRLVLGGPCLEYKMTAETLAKPYSHTRYYKKLDAEAMDGPCQDEG